MRRDAITKQSFYEEKIRHYTRLINAFKKQLVLSAIYRVSAFVALAVSVYFLVQHFHFLLIAAAVLSLLLFIFLVKHAVRLNEQKTLHENLLFVNENELGVINNKPNKMDDGKAFNNGGGYASDLDIFGPGSLFHLLNRNSTSHGRLHLANLLIAPPQHIDDIKERQQAVKAFAPQVDMRQLVTAYGLMRKEEEGNLNNIEAWLNEGELLYKRKWLQVLRWILPVYNTFFLLLYIANGQVLYLLAGVGVGWLITGRNAKYIHKQHELIGKKQAVLDQYADILCTFSNAGSGNAALLQRLQKSAGQAHKTIKALAKLSSMFDQRLNLLVNVLLNSIVLYDLQCILELEKWKAKNKADFNEWLHTVGEIESLNAFAGFAFNNENFVYPLLLAGDALSIETKQVAHPLIPANERIANDFEAGNPDKLLLVTGSNMSGKTTFLRTLGVNLILAQCGAPVCAASFSFSPMQLLTSIRISDSLQEHTSYFMAELKKLQQIIHELQTGKPYLVLIDEILRGTNSEDKTHGSEQFILQLIQYNCITLFATHDLMLASLENEHKGIINNWCFESIIENGELHFDYKLRKGVARNRNASFLMKKMGITGK
ncbi:hypothetical protein DC498_07290 [Terrimonas sp.]|uniref:MutS-related protein n=1 Tax=Terrimonas sp. TaxID=1914338 RepID=UPI000D5121DB|nr:hypothetical protein [Terrimonas sp.]PVD52728.1 hypothetical protein DC498_07290 [Terrimonas sp.]